MSSELITPSTAGASIGLSTSAAGLVNPHVSRLGLKPHAFIPRRVGFVALALARHFQDVRALDPAKKMVQTGLQPSDSAAPRIRYAVGNAEDLAAAGIGEGENGVDLVVAGESIRKPRRI